MQGLDPGGDVFFGGAVEGFAFFPVKGRILLLELGVGLLKVTVSGGGEEDHGLADFRDEVPCTYDMFPLMDQDIRKRQIRPWNRILPQNMGKYYL